MLLVQGVLLCCLLSGCRSHHLYMNFRNIFRPCVLYKISSSYIPAFIQNGNQMKRIVLVFQIVDGTPIIGMRGSLFYYRFRMANHEKEALPSLIAPFALAYMPTVHPVKPPADSVL